MHQSWDKVFLAFQTFSPGLEKNEATKCGSENFPRTVTYILCVEKCQNHILMHSFLPIPGRPFKNVMDSGSESETYMYHIFHILCRNKIFMHIFLNIYFLIYFHQLGPTAMECTGYINSYPICEPSVALSVYS